MHAFTYEQLTTGYSSHAIVDFINDDSREKLERVGK